MKISYEEFEKVVKRYYHYKLSNDEYLENVPSDIKAFIYDNEYANNLHRQSEMILEEYFGEKLHDWFSWFLWDAKLNKDDSSPNVFTPTKSYHIYDLETFLNYMKIEHFNG